MSNQLCLMNQRGQQHLKMLAVVVWKPTLQVAVLPRLLILYIVAVESMLE